MRLLWPFRGSAKRRTENILSAPERALMIRRIVDDEFSNQQSLGETEGSESEVPTAVSDLTAEHRAFVMRGDSPL